MQNSLIPTASSLLSKIMSVYGCLSKRKKVFLLTGILILGGIVLTTIGLARSNKSGAISSDNSIHNSYTHMFEVTGHIVSIDEEANTFQLRVPVEDDSERILTVHFSEKSASGVPVNVSDYKIGDHITISYFPYDRKGSYIDADSAGIFNEKYDRIWKDDQNPEIIRQKYIQMTEHMESL